MTTIENRYLAGNFAPVEAETTAVDLPVTGTLPEALDGRYLRNGPNPLGPVDPRLHHWFVGTGMVHGIRLRGGRAEWYRSRYVLGDATADALGRPRLEGPRHPLFGGASPNTNVIGAGGTTLAIVEAGGHPVELTDELESVRYLDFDGTWDGGCTAHPKVDPVTGEFLFFGYQPVQPYLRYSVADASGVILRTTAIDIPRAVMMHDFAVTEKHTLFLDLPVTMSFGSILARKSPFAYEPRHGARIGVLPRHAAGKQVRWFEVKPCYVFHTLNAHDEGDDVVLLGCRMDTFPDEILPPDQLTDRQMNATGGKLYRWRLNRTSGKVTEGPVDDLAADFPRVDDALTGRRTRYGYLMALKMDALLKYDLTRDTRQRHELGKGRLGGEGVFVPRPGAKAEDDGWLVCYVFDQASNKSELVVLDARDFTARPVARVLLPDRVPFGFHGTWLPQGLLGKA